MARYEYLIAPVAVDARQNSDELFRESNSQPSPLTEVNAQLDDDTLRLLTLKQSRDSSDTAVTLHGAPDVSGLRVDRRDAFELSRDILREIGTSASQAMYLFADLDSIKDAPPTMLYTMPVPDIAQSDYVVRAEESLVAAADTLIASLRKESKHKTANHVVDADDTLHYVNHNQQPKSIALRGYTFNRKATDPDERIHFPHVPSCLSFMAAAALEQCSLSEQAVRIVPSSMRAHDIAARDILRLATKVDHRPLTTIALSHEGSIGRTVSWGGADDTLKKILRAHTARHRDGRRRR